MHPMLHTAIRAARMAGNVINRALEHHADIPVETKGRHDFVTEVDRAAEETIIDCLSHAYPEHTILAEESGTREQHSAYRWMVDPLDGTTNFIHGLPHFGISIALEVEGQLQHGVIYDPAKNDLFTTSRGSGAYLNDRRIRVSDRKELDGALLATGFPARSREELLEAYLDTFRAFLRPTSGIRRFGAAALDLAYVACGHYDGFWEFNLNPWDLAAGVLLVREAGGVTTDFGGEEHFFSSGNIVASNPRLQHSLITTLRQVLPPDLRR